jgi:hypothetical protein
MKIVKNVNKFEVLEGGFIQVRLEKQLIENDSIVEHLGFERFLLNPDTILDSIEYDEIRVVAQVVWTSEIVQAYKLSLEKNLL